MEYGHPVAPHRGPVLDHNPQRPLYDDPAADVSLRSVLEGEEEQHEKTPVLKKVKDKVKKLKDAITKKRHAHDDVHEVYVEEGEEEDDEDIEVRLEVHGAPIYQFTDARNVLGGRDEHPVGNPQNVSGGRDEYPERVTLGTGREFPGCRDEQPEHVILRTDQNVDNQPERVNLRTCLPLPGREEHLERVNLGTDTTLDEDPAAPLPYGGSGPTTTGVDTNRPTHIRGNTLEVSPDVLFSLETMAISVQREEQQRDQQRSLAQSGVGDVEKKPSYTEKLSLTAAAAKEAAVSAASTVYSTVAGTVAAHPTGTQVETMPAGEEKGPNYTEKLSSTAAAAKDAALFAVSTVYAMVAGKDEGGTHEQVASPVSTRPRMVEGDREEKGSYTEKLSGTALAAKDGAVSAASTVYGKVAGAGTAVMGKVKPGGGTEPSMTEYLSEKLRPGDEDRALCEVISETMQKKGEEDRVVVEKGRVVLPEVTSHEGIKKGEVSTDERSGGPDGEKGMGEKIKETVTTLVDGGASDDPPAARVETPLGGGRGWARKEVDY